MLNLKVLNTCFYAPVYFTQGKPCPPRVPPLPCFLHCSEKFFAACPSADNAYFVSARSFVYIDVILC